MAIQNNSTSTTAERDKVNVLRDIANSQRLVANNLQNILAALQRIEMRRK